MALCPAGWMGLGSKGLAPARLGGFRMTHPSSCHGRPGDPDAGSATRWQHSLVLGLGNCWRPTEAQAPFSAVSRHLSIQLHSPGCRERPYRSYSKAGAT